MLSQWRFQSNRQIMLINQYYAYIIMFVLTYICFSIFLSICCDVMLVTIKKKEDKN